MLVLRRHLALFSALATTLLTLAPESAVATTKLGPIQLSGNLQSQNLARSADVSSYQFIQNRNTAHFQFDYDWLQAGKFYNKYTIPFLESSHLLIKYRGVYDSIYDTTPGILEKEDIHGKAYGGLNFFEFAKLRGFQRKTLSIDGFSQTTRDALKFDNQLREAYADIKFRGIPLTVRAGRQQIVWGETDNFRMLDRANPLNLTWHLQQEVPAPAFGWDELRRTFWMMKFLYDLGDIYRFSQNFLEWYWNPGDWAPAKQAFLPRPWGLRFYDPLTNPVDGGFIAGICANSSVLIKQGPNKDQHKCTTLMNGTKFLEKGNYSRNPLDNSQVGIRYHGIAPFGLEFSFVYFYQRWAGDDGTNFAPLRVLPKNDKNNALAAKLESKGIFPGEYITPYVHSIGMAANYSDETYTQTVFRAETIYDVGIPIFDIAKETVADRPAVPGITNKNMWKGMIAFDRPTWIRAVNKKTTVFLTGQFFFHYMIDNPSCQPETVAALSSAGKKKVGSCLIGGLDLPSTARLGTTPDSPAFRDKIRDWETLFTLAAFTFYRGGSIVPVLGMAVDPTNQFNMEPFWTVDYVVRDDFVVNIAQRYFVTPMGHSTPIFESWGLAGINSGRSETEVRLTYQF